MTASAPSSRQRVDWVDYAKGFCICFVVMMHSTLGVEQALGQQGWMHALVAFAKPFRMPDFFMISGLFLAQVIARDWRTYLDRKVAHFAYFYVLWTAIQFAVKAPAFLHESGLAGMLWAYIESFWEPFGTLWFIYLLPVFFVVTKLAYQWRIPPLAVWIAAAGLQIAAIDTGHMVIDEFAARFVYFYTGYLLAPRIFALASYIQALPESAFAGLAAWALLNGLLVFYGFSELPLVGLALGLIGAIAVVAISALMAKRSLFRPLRYLRTKLHRHLPGLLLVHGREPDGADQRRLDRRYRDHLGAGDARRRDRPGAAVLGRAPHATSLPVRAADAVLADDKAAPDPAAGGVNPLTSSFRGAAQRRARNDG